MSAEQGLEQDMYYMYPNIAVLGCESGGKLVQIPPDLDLIYGFLYI